MTPDDLEELATALAQETGALLLATLAVTGPIVIPLPVFDEQDGNPPDLHVQVDLGAGTCTLAISQARPS